MIKLLWSYLFNPCEHDWEFFKSLSKANHNDTVISVHYVFICKKCLKEKRIKHD
jgi:hypothetical protein